MRTGPVVRYRGRGTRRSWTSRSPEIRHFHAREELADRVSSSPFPVEWPRWQPNSLRTCVLIARRLSQLGERILREGLTFSSFIVPFNLLLARSSCIAAIRIVCLRKLIGRSVACPNFMCQAVCEFCGRPDVFLRFGEQSSVHHSKDKPRREQFYYRLRWLKTSLEYR